MFNQITAVRARVRRVEEGGMGDPGGRYSLWSSCMADKDAQTHAEGKRLERVCCRLSPGNSNCSLLIHTGRHTRVIYARFFPFKH